MRRPVALAADDGGDKYAKPGSLLGAARRQLAWAQQNKPQAAALLMGTLLALTIVSTVVGGGDARSSALSSSRWSADADLNDLGISRKIVSVTFRGAGAVSGTVPATAELESAEDLEDAAAAEEDESDPHEDDGASAPHSDDAASLAPERGAADLEEAFADASPSVGASPRRAPGSDARPFASLSMADAYENAAELERCPHIRVPASSGRAPEWWGVKAYSRMYREHPVQACVPVLRRSVQLRQEDFEEHFRRWGRPVVLHFDSLRHLGFEMQARTLEDLERLFPFDPAAASTASVQYEANRKYAAEEEIDLGPAIHSWRDDGKLVRARGGKRNFPRNMKVRPESMATLGVQLPPLVRAPPGGELSGSFQTPSLWMGTSTSGTQFHHDCCDNFVMMVFGTKRFTLAPTTDWHPLKPKCVGKLKSLCYANIAEPTADEYKHFNKLVVDVKPGQILYMPAGWFHHIENLGPTLMVNVWTRSKETLGVLSCNKRRT